MRWEVVNPHSVGIEDWGIRCFGGQSSAGMACFLPLIKMQESCKISSCRNTSLSLPQPFLLLHFFLLENTLIFLLLESMDHGNFSFRYPAYTHVLSTAPQTYLYNTLHNSLFGGGALQKAWDGEIQNLVYRDFALLPGLVGALLNMGKFTRSRLLLYFICFAYYCGLLGY